LIIKEDLLDKYDFDSFYFSKIKSINRTTVVLYDKGHKEGLKSDLSRFEVRLVSKDIKGSLMDKKAILELIDSIYKVLNRYRVYVDSELINLDDFDVKNMWLLNSYNNY